MTEITTRTGEHVLTSDLWLAGESMGLTTPEEEVVAYDGQDARQHLCGSRRPDARALDIGPERRGGRVRGAGIGVSAHPDKLITIHDHNM